MRLNDSSSCFAGLKRTGKSCRLRWLNYLRPDVRRGNITPEEQLVIIELQAKWGNRWVYYIFYIYDDSYQKIHSAWILYKDINFSEKWFVPRKHFNRQPSLCSNTKEVLSFPLSCSVWFWRHTTRRHISYILGRLFEGERILAKRKVGTHGGL